MFASSRFRTAVSVLLLGGVAACADTTGTGGARPVSLSFSTGGLVPVASAGARFALAGSPGPLVITKAQLVFSKLELERMGLIDSPAGQAREIRRPERAIGGLRQTRHRVFISRGIETSAL